MATKNPRVALSLPADVKATYERYAAVLGVPASRAMANILIESNSAIQEVTDALELSSNPAQALAAMSSVLREKSNDAQTDIVDQLAGISGSESGSIT